MSVAQTQAPPAAGPRMPPFAAVATTALLAVLAMVLTNDFYLRILFMCGVYYLCAAGMNVLAGYAGQKSLGQAGLFAAGAYAAALLTTRWGWHPAWALLAAPLAAALVGLLIALPSLRVKGPSLALVTLAFGIVVEKLVTEWTDVFGGAQGIYGIAPLAWADAPFSLQQWVWLVLGLSLLVHLVLKRVLQGRFGRALLSLQFDEIAAACSGIAVYRYKTLAFMVAAALCGLAGALVAQQNQYFNSDFITFHLSVFILLLVLLGGAGTIYGPLAGAVVLTLAEVFLAQRPFAQHFIYGAMLLFALYLMPRGIVGLFDRRRTPAAGPTGVQTCEPALPHRHVAADVPLLQLKGICKNFGGVMTAQNIDLVLQPRHIHALIGPNGAGKSTLINILTGVIAPSAGTLMLQGRDMTHAGAHKLAAAGVARTFQNLRLFGVLSVLDNVLVGAHTRLEQGVSEAQARQEALDVLAFTGLSGYAQAVAGSLPYGVQRRVELARALASVPRCCCWMSPPPVLTPRRRASWVNWCAALAPLAWRCSWSSMI